jgi:hypothetical protein
MDDLVCLRITDRIAGTVYALTWGRVFDPVEPEALIQAVKKGASSFGLRDIEKIYVCESLSSGAKEKYFFEGLFSFSQKQIPFGARYKDWTKQMRREIAAGKSVFVITDRRRAASTGRQKNS